MKLWALPASVFTGNEKLSSGFHTLTSRLYRCSFRIRSSGKCEIHNHAVSSALDFKDLMEQRALPVDRMAEPMIEATIQKNRKKIGSIVDTVILCGKQNLAYRGRRDDSSNCKGMWFAGNFQALLQFRANGGDTILSEHLETAAGNATYRSKTIQTEFINLCGDYVLDKIVSKIKKAPIFAIMADEVEDSAHVEQMPVAVRFVDSNRKIREEFLG